MSTESQFTLARESLRKRSLTVGPRWVEDRHAMIANAAYSNAACRGFIPGHELEDWLKAEAQIDARLMGEHDSY